MKSQASIALKLQQEINEKCKHRKESDPSRIFSFRALNGFVWKCWVNIPNEIAI